MATTTTSTAPVTTTTIKAPQTTAPQCIALSGWSNSRLAALTVAVPAAETGVSSVRAEVSEGAGGVILFGTSAPADLGSQLSALRSSVPGHLGLWVMTDEEGGGIQRMANVVGNLPWASYMGRYWTAAEITSQVEAVAARMASHGVNMDLAPVVDVDGRDIAPGPADPDGWRSFSGTTAVVVADGAAFAAGLERGGVTPVLKHFPGLGGSTGNSDAGPAHTLPWSSLQLSALPPFREGIEDGVPAIMVSNDVVPGLGNLPASLSPAVIEGELVDTLHFGGLIITDSLRQPRSRAPGTPRRSPRSAPERTWSCSPR